MKRRGHRRAIRFVAGLAVALAIGGCTPGGIKSESESEPPPPAPAPTASTALIDLEPAEIQNATIKAMRAVGYVHSVAEVKVGGVTLRVATDSGPDVGLQVLSAGTRRVEIRFVKEVAYLKGNRGGLEELLGADASSAKKYANKWISLTVADGGYAEISSALTMESLIETITLSGDMSKTDVTTIGDREVIGVNGEQGTGGTGTLYVATKGPALLIRLDGRVETQKGTVEFSRWGRHFKVEAPSGAVRAFDLE